MPAIFSAIFISGIYYSKTYNQTIAIGNYHIPLEMPIINMIDQ